MKPSVPTLAALALALSTATAYRSPVRLPQVSSTICGPGAVSCPSGCTAQVNDGAYLTCQCADATCFYDSTYGALDLSMSTDDTTCESYGDANCPGGSRRRRRQVPQEPIIDLWDPESADPDTISEDEMQPW